MAGYGDILDSFISGQNQALANQMDMARLRETQNQNRLAQSNWRQQFSADERQRAITNQQNAETLKINQGNLAINQNQDSRAQTEFDDRTLMQNKSRAARDLEQLVGTQGTLESALAAGDIKLDDVDLFLRNHGTTLGLFNGTDGSPRQYRGVEQIIGPDGQPVPGAFTFRLYDPRTMLDGPMTSEGGSGGQERVEIFDYAKLQPMLRQIDRTARTMRGDASRTDLTQFAESNNQLLTNQPLQSNASNAALAAPAQPAQTSQPTPVETPVIPTGVAGGRGNTVEAPNARQAAYVTAQRDSALAEFDQQVAPLQRKARWEELSMRRRGFLSPEEIDELDALQQEFGGFQRPGRGGARTGNENRDAFTAAMEGRAALAAQFQIPQVGQTTASADPANQTAQYNPQALAAPAAPATQTSSQRVAAKTQELVNAVTPQTDSMRDAMVTQRNVGLGMIDQGINYRGRPRTADELGVAFALGRNGQQYDLYGNAQNRDADLSSTDISNYVSGDDVRGTNLEQAGRMATAGSNLTSQANTALTSMRNRDVQEARLRAKDAADANKTPDSGDWRTYIDYTNDQIQRTDVLDAIRADATTDVFGFSLVTDNWNSEVEDWYKKTALNIVERTDKRIMSSDSPFDSKQLSDAAMRGIYAIQRQNAGDAFSTPGKIVDFVAGPVSRFIRDKIIDPGDIDTTKLGGEVVIGLGLSNTRPDLFFNDIYKPLNARFNQNIPTNVLLQASAMVGNMRSQGLSDGQIQQAFNDYLQALGSQ